MAEQTESTTPDFERRISAYFVNLERRIYNPVIRLHKAFGHYDKEESKEGIRHKRLSWGNVPKHCLVEAARAEIFADLLGFSPELRNDAIIAAGVHDFRKKEEITSIRAGEVEGTPEEKQNIVTGKSGKILAKADSISNQTKFIAGASGAQGVPASEMVLDALIQVNQTGLTSEHDVEIAFLVQHYIDDYTDGFEWVPEVVHNDDGTVSNALNQRLAVNRIKYAKEDEDGRRFYGGRTTSQAQEECSTRIQSFLTDVVLDRNPDMLVFEPYELPGVVDNIIKERIGS